MQTKAHDAYTQLMLTYGNADCLQQNDRANLPEGIARACPGLPRSRYEGKHRSARPLSEKTLDLIRDCKNITAICSKNTVDSAVVTQSGETIFSNLNLWDLNEMLKEVF